MAQVLGGYSENDSSKGSILKEVTVTPSGNKAYLDVNLLSSGGTTVTGSATTTSVSKATGDGRRITATEHNETISLGYSKVSIKFIRVSSSASRLFEVEIFD